MLRSISNPSKLSRNRGRTLLALGCVAPLLYADPIQIGIHFDRPQQEWDGFGVNYVETRHTRDYQEFRQDYGGMKYLDPAERAELIDLVFGEDGLQPDIVKAFLDPFHEPENDNDDPYVIDESKFDHETTTPYLRYFLTEGLKATRERGDELSVLAGLYGPPDWTSAQKTFRGRDPDPELIPEIAEYLVAWAKYLKEDLGAKVDYVSLHNEGESHNRWPEHGRDATSHYSHDFNMFWREGDLVEYMIHTRSILDANGLSEIGVTNGEPTTWFRFTSYVATRDGLRIEYPNAIRSNPDALAAIDLITSHGFDFKNGLQFDPRGINHLREARPELKAWTTSCSWDNMSLMIVEQAAGYIYTTGVNGIIPWATVHNNYESDKLHEPRGFRISGNANSPILTNHGVLETTKAYYFFKQLTRAGKAGMQVAAVTSPDESPVTPIAWSAAGSEHPDAFILVNAADQETEVQVALPYNASFHAFATQDHGELNYSPIGVYSSSEQTLSITLPERSVLTFIAN